MNIVKVQAVYFSPNQSTKKILLNVLGGMQQKGVPIVQWDNTKVAARGKMLFLPPDNLLVAAMPCYGGRIPFVAPKLFSNIRGKATPAVIVACYGSAKYQDAVREAKDILEAAGFVVFAAAAFPTQHTLARAVGAGRPDKQDFQSAKAFGLHAAEKLHEDAFSPIAVPGDFPYVPFQGFPYKGPATDATCTFCMACYKWCPTEAIPYYKPNETDYDRCIRCQCCVNKCPIGARAMTDPIFLEKIAVFEGIYKDVHKEPEEFG